MCACVSVSFYSATVCVNLECGALLYVFMRIYYMLQVVTVCIYV